jgi:hypothetical protein
MSGKHRKWTKQERDARAAAMRERWKDPVYVAAQKTKREAAWIANGAARREAAAERLRLRWQDPEYRARQCAALNSGNTPENREKARQRMLKYLQRRRTDADTDATWRAAMWQFNGSKKKRAACAENMRKIQARPGMRERARELGRNADHQKANEARWRYKRGGPVPQGFQPLYRLLRRKGVNAREALRLVKDHIKFEARSGMNRV